LSKYELSGKSEKIKLRKRGEEKRVKSGWIG
jgi:hypothetical protein